MGEQNNEIKTSAITRECWQKDVMWTNLFNLQTHQQHFTSLNKSADANDPPPLIKVNNRFKNEGKKLGQMSKNPQKAHLHPLSNMKANRITVSEISPGNETTDARPEMVMTVSLAPTSWAGDKQVGFLKTILSNLSKIREIGVRSNKIMQSCLHNQVRRPILLPRNIQP